MANQTIAQYPKGDRSILIPLLQDIQDEFGYLPEDVLTEAAAHIGMPLSSIYGVATFYNQFRLTPLGKNIIRVCRGTACHVKNSANILFGMESALNLKPGQTSRDKNFTLEVVSCIGACSIAPVVCINDDYYGRITVKEIDKILKKYQPTPAKAISAKSPEVTK